MRICQQTAFAMALVRWMNASLNSFTPPRLQGTPTPIGQRGKKLLGLIFVGQEMKVIRRGTEPVEVFNFRHEYMPNEVLYSSKICVHVTVEGPPEYFSNWK